MDVSCLAHSLTEEERLQFERDGYFFVENALDSDHVARLCAVG